MLQLETFLKKDLTFPNRVLHMMKVSNIMWKEHGETEKKKKATEKIRMDLYAKS